MLVVGCLPKGGADQDPKRDPDFLRGQNLLSQLDYEGATRSFKRALAGNPQSAPAHFELGFLAKDRADDPAAAIYHFQQFLALEPDSEQSRLIRRHVDDCKMELAKLFLIAPVVPDAQRELDRLKDVVKELQNENESLRREIAAAQTAPVEPDPEIPAEVQPATQPVQQTRPEPLETPRRFADTPLPVPAEPVPAAGLKPVSYTIRNGDYPAKIAKQHGIKLEALLKANPGLNPRRLKIGDKVTIPTG